MASRKTAHLKQVHPAGKSDESKEAKFIRLATARMNRALHQISLVGNLAAANYHYSPEQVETIEKTLVAHVTNTMSLFKRRAKKDQAAFRLTPAELD